MRRRSGGDWSTSLEGDFVLRGLRLTNAIELFNEIHKKPAWADRYGNSFEQVKRLIDTSRTRRRVIRLTGAAVAGALVAFLRSNISGLLDLSNLR